MSNAPALHQNALGQPIGFPVPDWQPCPLPPKTALQGRYVHLEPLDATRHTQALYQAFSVDVSGHNWTYLPYGPFTGLAAFQHWLESFQDRSDPLFHTLIDPASGEAVGLASYLRITPEAGVIEVGHIHFSPRLQRTRLATEAMYLLMRRAFDELGYRRYEWKCDALNTPSRAAAERLGFRFEGIFRQAALYKGRNRDTAWYSILDQEWPALRAAFETWLDPANFDTDGKQHRALGK
ncbi:MAG: GNAT family N-acetyltransferase [Thiothrix sp.]|nr:GNAT family N-acetyltransferase [Thiothrix sp.]HPQ96299.1 GNAT family protein [Thiolinea sp.]